MKINNLSLLLLAVASLATGCVSTQKYNELQKSRDHFRAEAQNLKALEKENQDLQSRIRVGENQLSQIKGDLANKTADLTRLQKENQELVARFDEATKENAKILSSYSTDKTAFEEEISANQDELYLRERQLQGLENTLGVQSYGIESMRLDMQSREKRVAELEKLLAEKEAQMAKLQTSLDEALRSYTNGELTVSDRNGKIYVTLSQRLLFKTNSDQVDASGEQALAQLAKALQANPAIEIVVEGHTDNKGGVDYNWNLSTRRATAVARVLSLNGIEPARLTAAGRGMHQPLVPNDSETNMAKNRRTEIILSPNLDKLLEITR